MDLLGGAGEVERLGDGREVAELLELHPPSLGPCIGRSYAVQPDHVLDLLQGAPLASGAWLW
ncbi:hypothetical protein GCM10023329_01930 [Streptomyces sanyensis]|uniref:Uncharacterized protein n=1 Tax=Streptomyces sanyensis TaxID=568869 RepID=A0ABP8ZM91_9ACTN